MTATMKDTGNVLAHYGYDRWAASEWDCRLKPTPDAAAKGAPFIAIHIIRKTEKAFDDLLVSGRIRHCCSG